MAAESNDKLLQIIITPIIKSNKKHLSQEVVSITCTLEEQLFAAATFECL